MTLAKILPRFAPLPRHDSFRASFTRRRLIAPPREERRAGCRGYNRLSARPLPRLLATSPRRRAFRFQSLPRFELRFWPSMLAGAGAFGIAAHLMPRRITIAPDRRPPLTPRAL